MIDTVKVGIPLTRYQLEKLNKLLSQDDRWQWVQLQPTTGEVRFLRVKGVTELDRESFHREIAWYIPDHYNPEECCLVVELSVPKFWYGHNIYLLYGFLDALRELKKTFEKQLNCRFVDVLEWRLFRVDICYAWKTPSQNIARQILDSLTHLHYPRKKPTIYPGESILFVGRTYSLKFYLKLPEFLKNDRKALLRQKASLDWINYLEKLATGVLRCEATLRYQYLKNKKIETIGDLARPTTSLEWNQDFIDLNPGVLEDQFKLYASIMVINGYTLSQKLGTNLVDIFQRIETKNEIPLEDGDVCEAPPMTLEFAGIEYRHNGGGYTVRKKDNSTTILQYFIQKFIGDNRGMDTADQVKTKLLDKYKTNKAARLLGFWLHVQRFGSENAKELYGRNPYYVAKTELKEAGVSLIEPPKVLDRAERFIEQFSLDVPSPHVTNAVDDYRDSGNLLNLLQRDTAE